MENELYNRMAKKTDDELFLFINSPKGSYSSEVIAAASYEIEKRHGNDVLKKDSINPNAPENTLKKPLIRKILSVLYHIILIVGTLLFLGTIRVLIRG
jgi:hypothetical protein